MTATPAKPLDRALAEPTTPVPAQPPSGRVISHPTVTSNPPRPASALRSFFSHYSLLATTEQLLGLPRLGQAASAPVMTTAFHL